MGRFFDWAGSEAGIASVNWISASLSLIAIALALLVALAEQRRHHEAAEQEKRREREERERRAKDAIGIRNRYLDVCIEVLDDTCAQLDREMEGLPDDPKQYIGWKSDDGIPQHAIPAIKALSALQLAHDADAQTILTISRAIRSLEELLPPNRLGSAPNSKTARNYTNPRIADLRRRMKQLEDAKIIT